MLGLTIAYLAALADDVSFNIKVIARDLPEDMDSQAWTSPYAVSFVYNVVNSTTRGTTRALIGLPWNLGAEMNESGIGRRKLCTCHL